MFHLKSHCCGEEILCGRDIEQVLSIAKKFHVGLTYANIRGYWFLKLDLSGMDLTGIDLTGSVFDRCNFEGADLTDAIVTGATFHGCNLKGVNRTGVVFETLSLNGADVEDMYSVLGVSGAESLGTNPCAESPILWTTPYYTYGGNDD